jgi:EAL domain-containing protein (putative c-di-GMP-specific phosphodiesterase class I)/GGDEF domain-containing protein
MQDANQFQSLEEYIYTPYLRSFEIAYSHEHLISKAQQYALTEEDLVSGYLVDYDRLKTYFENIDSNELNDALESLFISIATWPEQPDLNTLTTKINECIDLWVESVKNNTEFTTIYHAFKFISLIDARRENKNRQWYNFIFDLIIETVFSYQQYQINYLLNYDGITHLPNTNLLLEKIRNKTEDNQLSTINIFNIRFLIDRGTTSISPIIPATLSIKIAELLESCLPKNHTIYQSGHLLFSILIESTINNTQLKLLTAKIQRCFEQIITIQHQAFLVSPVIGAAIYNDSHKKLPIFGQARIALNYALNNKQNFVLYNQDVYNEIEKNRKLELEITNAFNNEELELYFQPIMSLTNHLCVGAEVLLRWPNATTKGIYPNVMVEIINKVGLGKMFTRWLINSVCRLSNVLINEHQLPIYLTLNLRAEDLYDSDLPHLIFQSTQFWKISTSDIILEITENGILEENETTTNVIKQITDYGFKLALDDFGTGYSSMARLRTMPISLIKIDQSFVKKIAESKEDYNIVESMSLLANSLGKEVLVEGVESQEGLNLINQIGIAKAQGFFFSKPMPFDEFVTWVKKGRDS